MGRICSLILATLMLIAASPAVTAQTTPATPVATAPMFPVELRVMTLNVWLGGVQVNVGTIVETIEAARADVVGLQEAEGHTRAIADALGWPYADERLQVISRFPLIDPPGADGLYTFVEVRPGQVFAIANVHLPASPSGSEAVVAGASPEEVMAIELATRLPGLETHLARLPALVAEGIPVLLVGDFNTPSHLDARCCATAASGPVDFPLAWPVGVAAAEAGFVDSFRVAHPDALARPGLTWTPGYPHPFIAADVPSDRIDWILVAGEVETLASEVVGEADNPDVDIAVMPYPSDHRGVVSEVRLVPGTPPFLVAVHRRVVAPGEPVIVHYHAPGETGDRIALLPAGGDVATDVLMSLPPQEALQDGAVMFGTETLAPGPYEAALIGAGGRELARIPVLIRVADTRPIVTPAQPVFALGEPIAVAWDDAPGLKWDWIGIYAAGDSDLYNYLGFLYTKAEFSGTVTFTEQEFGGELPPGDYEARLMRDDGYVLLASAPFSVAADE